MLNQWMPFTVLAVLAACAPDGDGGNPTFGETPENTPPSIAITSPAGGMAFLEGDIVTVTVEVTDPDETDLSVLSLLWGGSANGAGGPPSPSPTGDATLDLLLDPGSHEVNVTATDPDGETALTTVHFTVEADADGDGHSPPEDCDDADAAIHPGAAELCNGIDDDCANGPDDMLTFVDWYTDADMDGFGDATTAVSSCEDLSGTHVVDGSDCDDLVATTFPGAVEDCNGVDDDCANGPDDGLLFQLWYVDMDEDGYGNATTEVSSCENLIATHVLDATDCDDTSATLNRADTDLDGLDSCDGDCDDLDDAVLPGAAEVCNDVDDNCVDGIDEGIPVTDWYTDADMDGYGDPASLLTSCVDHSATHILDGTDCNDKSAEDNHDDVDLDGFSTCLGDCDDLDVAFHPGASEICNGGVDDDCDPTTHETAMVDGVGYGSLTDALAATLDGGIVELCEGVVPAKGVIVDKVVTIMGAGGDRTATTLDGAIGAPSAMLRVDGGELHLQSLTIANANGGAVNAISPGGGAVFVDDCLFLDNERAGNGGAIAGTTITITNSDFVSNEATTGGAVHASAPGVLTVTDTTFEGNLSTLDGGAFFTAIASTFTGVDVVDNTAFTSGGGGSIAANNATIVFTDTLFSGNTAANGGALWALGASIDAGDTTTFDDNLAVSMANTFGGGVWVQANGNAITWTGGLFTDNVSDSTSFAAGGGMVLDANDIGAALGSIVATNITLDGNATIGPVDLHTGGGIWTLGGPITLTDILTMNNLSDFGAGTSLNDAGADLIVLERVEYRANIGIHAGATDVWQADAQMTDCVIEQNVGGMIGMVQFGALLVDDNSTLDVITSDLGVGGTENVPFDVLVDGGKSYNFGDAATFYCDFLTGLCL